MRQKQKAALRSYSSPDWRDNAKHAAELHQGGRDDVAWILILIFIAFVR
jgi:hypothetical protein